MNQASGTSGRQVLGSGLRHKWFGVLIVISLLLAASVGLVSSNGPAGILCVVFLATCWPIAFFKAIQTARTVVIDDAGLTVKTLLRTWQYSWHQIKAIRMGMSGTERVVRLQFVTPWEHPSRFAKLLARTTGGLGVLPFLSFDEFEILRQAIARNALAYSPDPKAGAVYDLGLLIDGCESLEGVPNPKAIGRLGSIALSDYAIAGREVQNAIDSGDWDKASHVQGGEPGGDWVCWDVVERENGEGAVVEIIKYVELYAHDEWRSVRTLSRHELEQVRPYVNDWCIVTPSRN